MSPLRLGLAADQRSHLALVVTETDFTHLEVTLFLLSPFSHQTIDYFN